MKEIASAPEWKQCNLALLGCCGQSRLAFGRRLTGLVWSGKYKDAVQRARHDLIATQRSDGGWADIDTTPSTAFDTGVPATLWPARSASRYRERRRLRSWRHAPPPYCGSDFDSRTGALRL